MNISVILDIVIVAIIAVFAFLGYKKGLIKMLANLVAGILAIIIAFMFAGPFGMIISEKAVEPTVKKVIVNSIAEKSETEKGESVEETYETLVSNNNIDKSINYINEILKPFGKTTETADTSEQEGNYTAKIINSTVKSVSENVGKAIAFVLIFIAVIIVMRFIPLLFKIFEKIPFVKGFNKMGGFIVGIVFGFLVSLALAAALKLSLPLMASNENGITEEQIQETKICKVFYNANVAGLLFEE